MNGNEEMSESHANSLFPNGANDTVFHAVFIPQENCETLSENETKEHVRVYQNKTEALKLIKAFKTGRLKSFKSLAEAEEYARTGYEENASVNNVSAVPTMNVPEEKTSNFKGPRSQELVCFRKLIESGDSTAVIQKVWGNPRYLISSGDTPAILQEGCRYNALHVAVKSEKPEMCELILSTISNPEFIKLLYGEEECKSYVDRGQIMLDLYLNTPDKGLNETPLHFAVKFGLKDVVRVLVSYPQCERRLRNKYKQLPIDIVCARKCQDDEQLKREIRMYLEDQYYVPVLRSEDNTLQPVIGEPFSPTSPMSFKSDPISPRVEVRAFAGPMTISKAIEFRKKWKTPPRIQTTPIKRLHDSDLNVTDCPADTTVLRLQDAEKGLERIGRNLAEEYQVPWKEYWNFLNDFANFKSMDGLIKLEKYLEKKFKIKPLYFSQNPDDKPTTLKESEDEIDLLCHRLQSYSLSCENDHDIDSCDDLDDLEFFTPPSSPKYDYNISDDEMEMAEEGAVIFLEGPEPTKLDYAVFNAVPASVDPNMHPNIYRWQHEMHLAINRNSYRSNNTKTRRNLLMNY